MHHFQFHNPTKIIFGSNQVKNLASNIPQGAKIMLTYGGGSIKANGLYDQVVKALAGFDRVEFGGIEPNPRYETLMKAVELVKKENVDFILAVGGGSVIDGTKFIALATYFTGDAYTICSQGASADKAVPFGTILTLPATGSEMNNGSVISRESTKEKYAFHSPLVFPVFSILDPTVTLTLPKRQRANGVVDSFVHITEQYLTFVVDSPVQDRFSEGLLQTLVEEGNDYTDNPEDMDAASNIVWTSTLALNGLIGVGVPQDWATHLIGHEITALTGLDHAQTLALVWPGLQRRLKDEKREKLLQFSKRVWGITAGSEDEIIEMGIQKTQDFFESLGVGTTFSAYGIEKVEAEKVIDEICSRFTKRGTVLGEKGSVTPQVVREILETRF